ncbi:hypothetical protein AAT19DRAFT_12833 [Rhodotorula toruloides]|uniref:Uncharacterized protein n=1 Tax=Rhodotorula toruloides TaxID=5286 RepID=A0A2T0ACT3_RHOTO|nr:hypothetical protein AAT19DRAFT_12833 [Rhodotorula toruloides]
MSCWQLELLHEKTLDRFSLSTSTRRARQDGWSVKDRRSSSLSLVSNTKRKVVLVVSRDRLARSLSPHPSSASTSTSLVDSLVSLLTVSLNSLGSLDSAVKNFATRLSFRKTRESGIEIFIINIMHLADKGDIDAPRLDSFTRGKSMNMAKHMDRLTRATSAYEGFQLALLTERKIKIGQIRKDYLVDKGDIDAPRSASTPSSTKSEEKTDESEREVAVWESFAL